MNWGLKSQLGLPELKRVEQNQRLEGQLAFSSMRQDNAAKSSWVLFKTFQNLDDRVSTNTDVMRFDGSMKHSHQAQFRFWSSRPDLHLKLTQAVFVPGCRTAVAPTKLMSVTSEAPPDSRGMGWTRKCSNMSKMDWNQRCWTRH